ncbi:MAG: type VI secretion system accessory protein TagJ [Aquabacterium sp.]
MSDSKQAAEQAIRDGDPQAALQHLTAAVRAKPADPQLRIFMAQLLCVLGAWERAHTQLNVVADMDAETGPMRETVGHAIRCELLRADVFAGKRTPMVFGQPDQWLALLIESLLQSGQGNTAMALDLAARAMEDAPATSGRIDGQAFDWLADGDGRLGPVLEACVNGRYYWVPFSRLSRVNFEPPQDLRDVVWVPAYLTFSNGGETVAFVPTRYVGTTETGDPAMLLSRKTTWTEAGPDRWHGLGQRVLISSAGEHDLLGIRSIEFDEASASAQPDAEQS